MQRTLHILVLLTLALMPVIQSANGLAAHGCGCGPYCSCCAVAQKQVAECAEIVQVELEQLAQVQEPREFKIAQFRAYVASVTPEVVHIPPSLAFIRTVRFLI